VTLPLLTDLANHLWQSTLVLGGACGLVWLLRGNTARARFRIWLVASAKFLVPYAPLIALGRAVGWPSSTTMPRPALSSVLHSVNQPFASTSSIVSDVSAASATTVPTAGWPLAVAAIWGAGCLVLSAVWVMRWLRVASLVRASQPLTDPDILARVRRAASVVGVTRPLRVVVSDSSIEPGVFGILRPVLVWPRHLGAYLTTDQIDGVLLHELAHVRRRDNLTALLHAVVETIFWFFPPVWWLERRLVHERELACDQAAVASGGDPTTYAEGILRTCEVYAEAPLTCMSGVTGSNLKARIRAIVSGHSGNALGMWRRTIIAAAASVAFSLPISLGVLQSPLLRAQAPDVSAPVAFDVASVKPNTSGDGHGGFNFLGPRIEIVNLPLFDVIKNAWGVQESQIVGGPDWIRSHADAFDITGTAPDGTTQGDLLGMLRSLLADRFRLRVHQETREEPIYALVVARSDAGLGPRIAPAGFDCDGLRAAFARGEQPARPAPVGDRPACGVRRSAGRMLVGGLSMATLARELAPLVAGRPVVDRTGLAGIYDLELTWAPGLAAEPTAAFEATAPSLFTAVQEQLGLRLQPTTGPIEVLVIDSVERPTPN